METVENTWYSLENCVISERIKFIKIISIELAVEPVFFPNSLFLLPLVWVLVSPKRKYMRSPGLVHILIVPTISSKLYIS